MGFGNIQSQLDFGRTSWEPCFQKFTNQGCARVSIYSEWVDGVLIMGTEVYVEVTREGECTCTETTGSDLDPGVPLGGASGRKLGEWCFNWTDVRQDGPHCSCPDDCKGASPTSTSSDTVKIPGLVGKTFADVDSTGVVSAWVAQLAADSIPSLLCCDPIEAYPPYPSRSFSMQKV